MDKVNSKSEQNIIIGNLQKQIINLENKVKILEENERRFKTAQSIGKIGNWEYNIDEKSYYGSEEAKRLFGIKTGTNSVSLLDIENCKVKKDELSIVFKDFLEGKRDYNVKYEIQTTDTKERKIIHSIGELIRDKNGRPIKAEGVVIDITELHDTTEKISENEARLHSIFNAMTDIVFEMDFNGTYLNIAPTSPELMYVNPEIAVGKKLHDVFPKQEADVFLYFIQDCINNNELKTINYPLVIRGRTFWFEGRATPMSTNSILFIARDITPQKDIKFMLKRKNEQLNQIMDNAKIGWWDWDIIKGLEEYNSILPEILGFKHNEIIDSPKWLETRIHPEDIQQYNQSLNDHFEGKTAIFSSTHRLKSKNNQWIWVSYKGKLLSRKSDGRPVRMTGTVIDVDKERRTLEKLADSEKKLSNLLNNLKGVAYRCYNDKFWTMNFLSEGIIELTGYKPEDFIDNNKLSFAEIIHDEDRKIVWDSIQESIKKNSQYKLTYRIIDINGKIKWVYEQGKYIDYLDEKKIYLEGLIVDVTDRITAEKNLQTLAKELKIQNEEYLTTNEELNQSLEKIRKMNNELQIAKKAAEQANKLKSSFLENLSHEIRTPMNSLIGFSELLKEPDLSINEKKTYINSIDESSNRMLDTISDLIDIATIQSGQIKIKKSWFDLNQCLNSIHQKYLKIISKKKIEFSINHSKQQLAILTDNEKLLKSLDSIIHNAIKFTDKGEVVVSYGIVKHHNEQKVEIIISDTGIGIPEKAQQIIFDPFTKFSFDNKLAKQGSGLGLSIASAYLRELGGEIKLDSDIDEGSCFKIILPYTSPKHNLNYDNVALMKKPKVKIKYSKLNILIAEDDKNSLDLMELMVSSIAKKILIANTGEQAVKLLSENSDIDLILMDVKMPEMDGLEAVAEIRKNNHDVVIIAQTAHALSGDESAALEAGCNDYIAKPIEKDFLIRKIRKHIVIKLEDTKDIL